MGHILASKNVVLLKCNCTLSLFTKTISYSIVNVLKITLTDLSVSAKFTFLNCQFTQLSFLPNYLFPNSYFPQLTIYLTFTLPNNWLLNYFLLKPAVFQSSLSSIVAFLNHYLTQLSHYSTMSLLNCPFPQFSFLNFFYSIACPQYSWNPNLCGKKIREKIDTLLITKLRVWHAVIVD